MLEKLTAKWAALTPAQKKALSALLAAVIAVLVAFGFKIPGVASTSPDVTTTTVRTPLGTTQITADTGDVEQLGGSHDGTRDETPASLSPEAAATAQAQADQIARRDPLSPLDVLAAPQQRGCRSQFVRSHSTRGGTKPVWIVSHYTVSPNLPGFRDINALTAYSNNSQNGVSWHYNVDRQGNCAYTVPETQKAWTQAAANRLSIGIEIINRGRGDAPLFTADGLKRYARLLSDIARRWNIPIQRGKASSSCRVIRRGLLDHNDLGACGGNHFDVTPYSIGAIIRAVKRYRSTTGRRVRYPHVQNFGPKRRAWCDRLALVRAHAHTGGWTKRRTAAARRYKMLIGPGQSRCRFTSA